MKKILNITLALALLMPLGADAAGFSFVPAIGSYHVGDTITTSVYVNPGAGETITATKVGLTFPADKLEVTSYTPVNGGNILAHVGTKHDNVAGTIVDNVAFNPGITTPTKVATIVFKAKADGQTTVAVSADTKILDSGNTNKNTSSSNAVFTVAVPTPATPPQATTTPPTTQQSQTKQPNTGGAKTQSSHKKTDKTKTKAKSDESASTTSTTTDEVASTTATGTASTTASTTSNQLAAAGASWYSRILSKWYYALLAFGLAWFAFFLFKKRKNQHNL